MTKLNIGNEVEILSDEFGDQAQTGVIMGFTSDFKEIDGQQVSDPTFHVEITEGEGEEAEIRSGNYKGDALQVLET